jgi:hypothetical protein
MSTETMRTAVTLTVLGLIASTANADRVVLPNRPLPGGQAGAPAPGFSGKRPAPGFQGGPVAPPHPSQAAVIELLEDDAGRLARCLNPGADLINLGKAGA